MDRQLARTTLSKVEREIEELENRRDDVDRTIMRLRRLAMSLRRQARSVTDSPGRTEGPQSLTNACRALLRMKAPGGLTTREIKHLLVDSGFPLDRFANPMSAVHTVLKRLVTQQEAVARIGHEGVRRFSWKRTAMMALTHSEARDDALLKSLLETSSAEEAVACINQYRSRRRPAP